MKEMKFTSPTLYSVSSTGKVKQWIISVQSNDQGESGSAVIVREHGYVGAKITRNEKTIIGGKNIGKSNETTPYQQALNDALSMRQKRLDTGYTEEQPNMETFTPPKLPMLAHKFIERKHKIVYPCFTQPKLDGVRCLAEKVSETEIVYTSRKGKHYDTLEHLTPTLLSRMKVGQIIDGEIYIHGKTFQEIVRLVKKLRPESSTLEYHVFDLAIADVPFYERNSKLNDVFDPLEVPNCIELVGTCFEFDEDGIYARHDEFVREGYEGVIIRNRDGMYAFDNRTVDLQKYKEFIDEEFEIVGGACGTGLHDGCVIFECKAKGGTFNVYPRGSLEQRRKMYDNLDSYIGKPLTVRYQQLSEDGIPIFPIGIVVRNYE